MTKPKIKRCPTNKSIGIGWTCIGRGYESFGMTVKSAYFNWKIAISSLEDALWHDMEVER